MVTFDGSEGKEIPATQAAEWTANYQAANPKEICAYYIGCDLINDILKQDGCVGIRMYNALTDDTPPQQQLVIVGVKSDGTDMTDGIIADDCLTCPPVCDTTSILY